MYVRDVGVGVKAERLGRVVQRHVLNVLHVLLDLAALGDAVALVEAEAVCKHVLAEPDGGEGVEQSLVEVVGDATAVLYLTQHVPHRAPRHACAHTHTSDVMTSLTRMCRIP